MNKLVPWLFICLVAVSGGADEENEPRHIPEPALKVLQNASDFRLYWLDPSEELEKPTLESFQNWRIQGRTTLKDAKTRERLVKALLEGVEEYKEGPAKCFIPHHGIRASHDGHTADFVICFTCRQIYVYLDGKQIGSTLVSDAPAELFNKVLEEEGVIRRPKTKN